MTDLPQDIFLPGLSTFLDFDKFRSLLISELGDRLGEIDCLEITYIRYKPATNCLVAYRLLCRLPNSPESSYILLYAKLFTKADYRNAEEKAGNSNWVDLYNICPIVTFPEFAAIIYFFPNDCLIDGLRVLADPRKLRRLIYQCDAGYAEGDWRIQNGVLWT